MRLLLSLDQFLPLYVKGYLAPSKIDPKFFDIKTALQQVDADQKQIRFRDFEGQKKRKALGYDQEDGLLYREASDMAFFEAEKPLEFLHQHNKILISEGKILHFTLFLINLRPFLLIFF